MGSRPTPLATWSQLRRHAEHTGYLPAAIRPPFRLRWACFVQGERLGTAMEPIVSNDMVFVATHGGAVYAFSLRGGEAVWSVRGSAPFLHAPACDGQLVFAADAAGTLFGIEASTGKRRWSLVLEDGGSAAAPAFAGDRLYIGTRKGTVWSVEASSGRRAWRAALPAPIRQTAAVSEGKVYVTAEDLRVYCLEAQTGKRVWTSNPLYGQTARDAYPVIVRRGRKTYVVVCTNPLRQFSEHLGRDRRQLCRIAGIEDGWQSIDRWLRSDESLGNPELWRKECAALCEYLQQTPDAQTFYVLDGDTGRLLPPMPVLYTAGCQGISTLPVVLPDGRLIVVYRSAYGNWSLGVAPFVAIGMLDIESREVTPLLHRAGKQPPWNTFWGTADESHHLIVADDTLLLVHQGTLSGFRWNEGELFPIWGERDTWGGFGNLPWARNEWHGPFRSGVAVVAPYILWQTGSRILCLEGGQEAHPAAERGVDPSRIRQGDHLPSRRLTRNTFVKRLQETAAQLVQTRWMPYLVEPGLASREFAFTHSGEVFEALAWAYPHLSPSLRQKVRQYLSNHWQQHPPFTQQTFYPLGSGRPREWARYPQDMRTPRHQAATFHPFGNLYAVWLYARRCGEAERVFQSWQAIVRTYEQFSASGWRLEPTKGDHHANHYISSLFAMWQLATQRGQADLAERARQEYQQALSALVSWWRLAAEQASLLTFYKDTARWDRLINEGDRLFLLVFPHRAHVALFADITPEVARSVRQQAPDAVQRVWQVFQQLCPSWHIAGEERQVHYGENFVDLPRFSVDAFRAFKWLRQASPSELARRVDLPLCRADVGYLLKQALCLEAD